jgi:hypothetical protein
MKIIPQLEEGLMNHHTNPSEGETCNCGSGQLCHVRCQECYVTSCAECFLRSHRNMRWHWANTWDPINRIFVQVDYSEVSPGSSYAALQLGHSTDSAPCSVNEEPQSMIVVHSNGIHNTKVCFCSCSNTARSMQLIQVGLFPGSPTFPQTAFTMTLLSQFQFHTRQSRASAFDWIVSLRRMTNSVSPHKVPVCAQSVPSFVMI